MSMTEVHRAASALCLVCPSRPGLCDPMDSSLPGTSVHGDSPGKTVSDLLHSVDIRHCDDGGCFIAVLQRGGDWKWRNQLSDLAMGGERRGFRMLLRYKHVERSLAICGMRLKTGKGGQK